MTVVPQPEALITMASSPDAKRSRSQASMLARARSRAAASCPRWWTSAPQQPLSRATTTSQPWRVSKPDRRLVDLRRQHLLGASRQQRDSHSPRARGREDARAIASARRCGTAEAGAGSPNSGGGAGAGRKLRKWLRRRSGMQRSAIGGTAAAATGLCREMSAARACPTADGSSLRSSAARGPRDACS